MLWLLMLRTSSHVFARPRMGGQVSESPLPVRSGGGPVAGVLHSWRTMKSSDFSFKGMIRRYDICISSLVWVDLCHAPPSGVGHSWEMPLSCRE